jgi:hypothetical protein
MFISLSLKFCLWSPVNYFRNYMVYLSITTTVCLLIRPQAHLIRYPSSSTVNDEPSGQLIVVYTWLTNLDCLLHIPERSIVVKVFTCTRASSSRWSVRKILLSPWVQRLLVSVDYPCTPCYLMSTSYCAHPFRNYSTTLLFPLSVAHRVFETQRFPGAMTFRPSVKVSWMDRYLSCMTDGKDSRCVLSTWSSF